MKHRHKDIKGSRREFSFEIPAEEVSKRLNKAYKDINNIVTIPGFRKGKAPREILEKHHAGEAHERAARDLVNDSYWGALEESKTIPVGLPSISEMEFAEGKDARYKATVDIRPKIDLISYDKIKVRKKKVDIKDEDVEKYVDKVRESYAEFKDVDRPARKGDYVVCDLSGESEGKPLYDQEKNIWLLMDREQSLPELVDGLMGVSKGDEKVIKATLPHNKKEAIFTAKVSMIKEKELPEVTDEFVKKLGPFENVAKLKEAARMDLRHKGENDARLDAKNQILEQFLKGASFAPPQGLVDEERERLEKEAAEKMKKSGLGQDIIDKNIKEAASAILKDAESRVKLYFILDEIAAREGIDVTDEDVDGTLEVMARQSNTTPENVKKHYKDNDMLGYIKNQIKEGKIMDLLMKKVKIEEGK
jgi:trigger factor